MKDFTKYTQAQQDVGVGYDAGLRNHMIKVYNHMAVGLGISGAISAVVMSSPEIAKMVMSLSIVWLIAMLGMVFLVLPKMMRMTETNAKLSFYAYAVVLGLAISPIFLQYTGESVARAFFLSAATFLSMSIYGYTTKKDLTKLGTFAIIGVWGVFFASIINIFLGSTPLMFISSIVAVVASIALTAYDTQKIKQVYYQVAGDAGMASKAAIIGALQLYFDFVYMFINLLQLLGNRR